MSSRQSDIYTAERLLESIELALSLHVVNDAAPPEVTARLAFLQGFLKLCAGDWDASLRDLELAATHAPAWIDLCEARAEVLFRLDRCSDAFDQLAPVLAARPQDAGVWTNQAMLADRLHRNADAFFATAQALSLDPTSFAALLARARTLTRLDQCEAAQATLARAASVQPASPEPWIEASIALLEANRAQEAVVCAQEALRRSPGSEHATYTLGMAQLGLGDLRNGWRAFEARWRHPQIRSAHLSTDRPKWLGETTLAGRTILLWAEQGFGDTLQFCRYAPLVARDATVIMAVPPPLVRLMRTLAGVSRVVELGSKLPLFDCHIPMMSLPLAMHTTAETIPGPASYLSADRHVVQHWKARLARMPGMKVGLVWSAHPRQYDLDLQWSARRKSAALGDLAPLAAIPGIQFVSLQKHEDGLPVAPPAGMSWLDPTGELNDFADTAALVEALDLVITVDTAVAHLAGALGKPVWILLPSKCCWRWFRRRVTSPWYPSARLFRQTTQGDWSGVMGAVAAALRDFERTRRTG